MFLAMIGVAIIVFIVAVGGLVLAAVFSGRYRREREGLENTLGSEIVLTVSDIRTFGREKSGWRNNFPSALGWETTNLLVAKDCVLVTGRSKFPFVFQSEIQPFVLASDVSAVSARLNTARVFEPFNVNITRNADLELSIRPSSPLGEITVRLIFEQLGEENSGHILRVLRPEFPVIS